MVPSLQCLHIIIHSSIFLLNPIYEQDKVDEQEPVSLQSDFALVDESLADILVCVANSLTFDEAVCLWQAQTEDDNQHRRSSTKPE